MDIMHSDLNSFLLQKYEYYIENQGLL